jgi:hypothetical protein
VWMGGGWVIVDYLSPPLPQLALDCALVEGY